MDKRKAKAKRIRVKASRGKRPRLSVFVSNRHILAQIIDDTKGCTIAASSDREVGNGNTVDVAGKVGQLIAARARERKVGKVVFDRGGKKYHGRVQALAEGAREGGLVF